VVNIVFQHWNLVIERKSQMIIPVRHKAMACIKLQRNLRETGYIPSLRMVL
jgi:hypothetical protein